MQNKEEAEQLAKSINEMKSVENQLSDVRQSKAAKVMLKNKSFKQTSFTDIIHQNTEVHRNKSKSMTGEGESYKDLIRFKFKRTIHRLVVLRTFAN